MNRKLIFFDDTADLATNSPFPVDKKTAFCIIQLFCHRLNEIYEKEGIEAVVDIVWYGDAMKKVDRSFEHKSEYKGKKFSQEQAEKCSESVLASIPSKKSRRKSKVAKDDESGVDKGVSDSVDEVESNEPNENTENGNP